jgi:hypothetical protein
LEITEWASALKWIEPTASHDPEKAVERFVPFPDDAAGYLASIGRVNPFGVTHLGQVLAMQCHASCRGTGHLP